MIQYFKKTVGKKHPKEIDAFTVGAWVYVESPTRDELEVLKEDFSIAENILDDALDPNEAPRLEEEDGNVYIFSRAPVEREDGQVLTSTVLMVIGPKFFMTICSEPLPVLNKFFEGKVDFNTTQKTRFFLLIFYEMNRSYSRFVNRVNRKVRKKSADLEKVQNQDITQFVHFEITLNDFLSVLNPMTSVLENLTKAKKVSFYEEDRDLVEDLRTSTYQLLDTCRSNLRAIVNMREAFSTILTNQLNDVIRLLTVFTVVLTVPTFFASLFGMNVPVPFSGNDAGFWLVLGASIFVSASILFWFRKKRWI